MATTLVDLNRSGVPLIEIVSEPEIRGGAEAYDYLVRLKQILMYLDVCDGNMEEGSLRCDANVSVRPQGRTEFGTKTEIKNMNSFRNVERAIAFETARQIETLNAGGRILQETLLWNADKGTAEPMRSKEEAHDYRYFPEPDLLPLDLTPAWIDSVRSELPELPHQVRERLIGEFGIPDYDAEVLTESRSLALYYEEVARRSGNGKLASNWVMTEVNGIRNKAGQSIEEFPIRPDRLGTLVKMIAEERISGKIGKQLFELMLTRPDGAEELVVSQGLLPIDDDAALRARRARSSRPIRGPWPR